MDWVYWLKYLIWIFPSPYIIPVIQLNYIVYSEFDCSMVHSKQRSHTVYLSTIKLYLRNWKILDTQLTLLASKDLLWSPPPWFQENQKDQECVKKIKKLKFKEINYFRKIKKKWKKWKISRKSRISRKSSVNHTLKMGIAFGNGSSILNVLRCVFHSQMKIKCVMKMWIPFQ